MNLEDILHSSFKRVGVVAVNSTGYVEAIFACMEAGIVAVPLKNSQDDYRIQAAGVEAILTPTAHDPWMSRTFQNRNSDELALISFTSGTEGHPKGVLLTHHNLADVVFRLNKFMQVGAQISEYIGVPVYYSFGLGRCRAVASAGGRFFIPSNGFNPSEIATMLKRGEINAISAVPSLWRILLENKDIIGREGNRVRWIEIGSQYMNRQEKEALKTLFPHACIVQHYGLTEASRTTLLAIHQVEGEILESVGKVTEDVEIKLTTEGHIAIRGPHVVAQCIIDGKEVNV